MTTKCLTDQLFDFILNIIAIVQSTYFKFCVLFHTVAISMSKYVNLDPSYFFKCILLENIYVKEPSICIEVLGLKFGIQANH